MKIKEISFSNYKGFREPTNIELKPITVLLGKNSSGKSAIGKLLTLIDASLSGEIDAPLQLVNDKVSVGRDFRDIVYNRLPNTPVEFVIKFDLEIELVVAVVEISGTHTPVITKWLYKSPEVNLNLYMTSETGIYKDEVGAEFVCQFRGFILSDIRKRSGSQLNAPKANLKIAVDYIGPFRLIPPRTFFLDGRTHHEKIGVYGENAYNILGLSKHTDGKILDQVASWFINNFDNWAIDVKVSGAPVLELVLNQARKPEGFNVNLADVGQGMSQALPIIVRAFMPDSNLLIVIEQPELHLHQAVHGNVAELLVTSAVSQQNSYLIETHSENFILRLRRLIAEGAIKPNDVALYSIESQDLSCIAKRIPVNSDGGVDYWPEGVFAEGFEEIKAIGKARRDKKTQ